MSLRRSGDRSCIAILAHPYGLGQTAQDLLRLEGVTALEIFNATFNWMAKGLSTVHWYGLLNRGRCWRGLTVDDAHMSE